MYNLINQKLFYRVNAIIPEIQQDKIRNIFYTLLFLKKYALKNSKLYFDQYYLNILR